jgi:hypothetical protein
VNDCPRPLDPIDCEALAAQDEPLFAPDAAEHAASCTACRAAVDHSKRLLADFEVGLAQQTLAASGPSGLASRVIRIRPFSRREKRDLRLWAGPAAFGVLLFAAGFAILAAPGLTAGDQAGLGVAVVAPAAGLVRAALHALAAAAAAAPQGWDALSGAARGQSRLGFVALLLLAPAGFGLRRVLARAARRG